MFFYLVFPVASFQATTAFSDNLTFILFLFYYRLGCLVPVYTYM